MERHELNRVLENLRALAACEEAVADLYQLCADSWPEERSFWSELAVDQLVQATRLQQLLLRAGGSADLAASVRLFPPAAVNGFIAWVRTVRGRIGTGELDHRGALGMARDLEQSPILGEHFRVTRATEDRVAQYLLAYATEYGDHQQRIAARLAEELSPTLVAA